MKFIVEITINLPRDRVITLFDSTENLYKWQPDLISFAFAADTPANGAINITSESKEDVHRFILRSMQ